MKDKLDHFFIGAITSIIVPLLVISIYIGTNSRIQDFSNLIDIMIGDPDLRLRISTIGIIPNLFLFYIVNNRLQMNHFTRGFVLFTVLIGLSIIIWTQFI